LSSIKYFIRRYLVALTCDDSDQLNFNKREKIFDENQLKNPVNIKTVRRDLLKIAY